MSSRRRHLNVVWEDAICLALQVWLEKSRLCIVALPGLTGWGRGVSSIWDWCQDEEMRHILRCYRYVTARPLLVSELLV